ncbi:hypothetical protein PGQ11_008095 [Apiospora arundinis]|uniref:Uncharacterized protein n=1 Tax=Apiospora arundinis TaxID=335852 RepID=A0ABR2IF79_9PEZI
MDEGERLRRTLLRDCTLHIDVRLDHLFRMTCAHDGKEIDSRIQQQGNVQLSPQDLCEPKQPREST